MYVNQKCYVKWANKLSEPFTVANGVKQGAVISPLLFSIFIDNLFKELKQLGLGCHVGPTFAGAFGYADDVALIAPSLYGLKKMISVCESYAERYHITFNPTKSKLICYNIDPSTLGPICLKKQPISIVDNGFITCSNVNKSLKALFINIVQILGIVYWISSIDVLVEDGQTALLWDHRASM